MQLVILENQMRQAPNSLIWNCPHFDLTQLVEKRFCFQKIKLAFAPWNDSTATCRIQIWSLFPGKTLAPNKHMPQKCRKGKHFAFASANTSCWQIVNQNRNLQIWEKLVFDWHPQSLQFHWAHNSALLHQMFAQWEMCWVHMKGLAHSMNSKSLQSSLDAFNQWNLGVWVGQRNSSFKSRQEAQLQQQNQSVDHIHSND